MVETLKIAVWEGYLFLLGVLAIVAYQILTGKVHTRGLIDGTTPQGSHFLSASRVQLLIVTLGAAAQYGFQVAHNPHSLPDIPRAWLAALGASHILYLGNKFQGKHNASFDI